MVWHEVRPNHFEQPLGDTELAFSYFGKLGEDIDREHWSIHAVASISFDSAEDVAGRFRNAWLALRYEFPDLATVVDLAESKKKYTVLEDEVRSSWIQKTFFVEHDHKSPEALIATFRRNDLPTCHLLQDRPDHASLVVHSSHWRLDGYGAFHLMNRLLHLSSQANSAQHDHVQVGNLTPTYEDLIEPDPSELSKAQKRVAERLAAFFAMMPSAGFAADDMDADCAPKRTRSITRIATATATNELLAACRAHGISVTAAVQSALATITFRHAPDHARNRRLAISTPVDLRRHTPALQKGDTYATGIYMSVLYSAASVEDNFFARARQLMKDYSLAQDATWRQYEVPETGRQVAQFLALGPPAPPEPPSTTMCSSFGRVDQIVRHEYGDIRLDDVRVGVEILTRENLLHVWTFRGRLHLSCNFNEAYYRPETVNAYLQELFEVLSEALKVDVTGAAAGI